MPEVSVVVPSYNGVGRLSRLLRSLKAQVDADWEAIIVLDGSTDDSAATVKLAGAMMPVRAIALDKNMGRPVALNAGFEAAAGRVLVRCDDDLELPPTFLRNHVAHHAGSAVGVIGMCVDVFGETAYARRYGRQADRNIRSSAYALPAADRWRMWSANVSVTRETFDAVGPYDDDYRVYGWEDVDWGYRLHQLGVPVIIPSDIEALHHNPATSARERATKALASGASRNLFMAKHPEADIEPVGHDGLSPWGLAVATTARVTTPATVGAIGSIADAVSRVAPRAVGTKVVALAVEAAGAAASHQRSA
jgi:glycosyltransferase involved in cell wall biosynthesis